jgi:hypothetical protein
MKNFSTLPTYHPVLMELTDLRAQARNDGARIAARRAAWLKAQGLPEKKSFRFPVVWCSQCGNEFGPGDNGFSRCVDHKGL